MDRGRSYRRHQSKRMFYKAIRKYKDWYDMEDDAAAYARKTKDNLASCSCWMCGNQRKIEGITMQEKRALLDPTETLEEIRFEEEYDYYTWLASMEEG